MAARPWLLLVGVWLCAAAAGAQDGPFKENDAPDAAGKAAAPAAGEAASGLQDGGPTVVCDGQGGYRVAMAGKEILPYGACLKKHELTHLADLTKTCPSGCQAQPDGATHPTDGARCAAFKADGAFHAWRKASECAAYAQELACLRGMVKDKPALKGALKARVKHVKCSLTYWKCETGDEIDWLQCH